MSTRDEVRFISKVSSWGGGRYYIEIPESTLKSDPKIRELVEQWYREETPIIVELKQIHGIHRRIRDKL